MDKTRESSVTKGVIMKSDYMLIAARPDAATTDKQFTDAVMKRIINTKTSRSVFASLRRRRPVFIVLVVLLAIGALSSTAYAITYLWTRSHTAVTSSLDRDGRKTYSIKTEGCEPGNLTYEYKLKKGATLSDTDVQRLMSAYCEQQAVIQWAVQTWPNDSSTINHSIPGYVSHVAMTLVSNPLKNRSMTRQSITTSEFLLQQSDNDQQTTKVESDTKILIDGQLSTIDKLDASKAVLLVTRQDIDQKNQDDCTAVSCSSDTLRDDTKLVALVQLSYPLEYYYGFKDLVLSRPCTHNAIDFCPLSTDNIIVFWRNGAGDYINSAKWKETSGVIQSIGRDKITIQTRAGRIVTVHTDANTVNGFNARPTSNKGFQVAVGDTLNISYLSFQDQVLADDIPFVNLMQLELVIESQAQHQKY